uniref:BPTI/Kunitz inhibitor domain-containing protein n=1 Tax=Echeneis naucrates TaxID=173247 RepID=A0A665UXZ1_ECHNA
MGPWYPLLSKFDFLLLWCHVCSTLSCLAASGSGPCTHSRVRRAPEHQPVLEDLCQLPMDEGSCGRYTMRWYFNSQAQACRPFIYSGCEGNDNRFLHQEECEEVCLGETKGYSSRYCACTFSLKCLHVIGGGCLLAGFFGPLRCALWTLILKSVTLQKLSFLHHWSTHFIFVYMYVCVYSTAPADLCQLPMDEGSCGRYTMRWYFNSQAQACIPFIYYGCEGNDNRFLHQEECEEDRGQTICWGWGVTIRKKTSNKLM